MALETPGTILEVDTGRDERERLFAAATEDEGVATLEAHDATPRTRGAQERGLDLFLGHGGATRALAHG